MQQQKIRQAQYSFKCLDNKNLPLAPDSASAPITCFHETNKKMSSMNSQYRDVLWHVLYGFDEHDLAARCNIITKTSAADIYIPFIKALALPSAKRMSEYGGSEDLMNLLKETKALTECRVIFFLLLNVDEEFRRVVCDPSECSSFTIGGTTKVAPLCPYKAERLFRDLDTKCVHAWLRNETKSISIFLEELRMLYLIS